MSLAVDDSEVLDVAPDMAGGLARGPQHARGWTKRVLNHWVRDAAAIFEASLTCKAVGIDPDHVEALRGISEQRAPAFAPGVTR